MAIPLFGGHIGRRASDALAQASGRAGELGDAEVGEQQVRPLGLGAAHSDEEVGGFDILVQHVLVMGVLQRLGGLLEQGDDLGGREGRNPAATPEPSCQGALFAVGHHQVGEQLLVDGFLSIGVQGQNVGVVEPGDGFGLPLEEPRRLFGALALRVGNTLGSDDFDGDLLANAGIFGQVDLPHTAAAQQAIVTQVQSFQWHTHHLSTQTGATEQDAWRME